MMKKTLTRSYVTVEELDALARERLATHYALETARFSLASEDVRNEIVLSLHRSKSSSLSLSSSSFNGGENDEKDDVDGKNARENDEAFKRKRCLVEEDFENRPVRFVENDARVVESEGGGFVRRTGEIKRGSRIARGS